MSRADSRSTIKCLTFFFKDTGTSRIYTLSLHDALPIFALVADGVGGAAAGEVASATVAYVVSAIARLRHRQDPDQDPRSEEHTSELQSQFHLVCRLLLEKKKHETVKKALKELARWMVEE